MAAGYLKQSGPRRLDRHRMYVVGAHRAQFVGGPVRLAGEQVQSGVRQATRVGVRVAEPLLDFGLCGCQVSGFDPAEP